MYMYIVTYIQVIHTYIHFVHVPIPSNGQYHVQEEILTLNSFSGSSFSSVSSLLLLVPNLSLVAR